MRQTALYTVFELAKQNPKVVFVGSDLGAGTLKEMQKELPNQFFMEGIAEQHLIGFVSGLAKEGFIPYVNTIANFFTRRAFEQIAMDIALHNLPVRLLASGGGMVYAPLGPTHTAIDDLALMCSIPKLRVFAPGDANEMRNLVLESVNDPNPWYIRFGKGGDPIFSAENQLNTYLPKFIGEKGNKFLIFTTGILIHEALSAREKLKSKFDINTSIIHFPEISNVYLDLWIDQCNASTQILIIEEHIPIGGLFTRVLSALWEKGVKVEQITQKSLPFAYLHKYGNQKDHLRAHGLDESGIVDTIRSM